MYINRPLACRRGVRQDLRLLYIMSRKRDMISSRLESGIRRRRRSSACLVRPSRRRWSLWKREEVRCVGHFTATGAVWQETRASFKLC